MAIFNASSVTVLSWCCSTILGHLIIHHVGCLRSIAGLLTPSRVEGLGTDDSFQASTSFAQSSSWILIELPHANPSDADYLVTTMYQPALPFHLPRLHRKLFTFGTRNVDLLHKTTSPHVRGGSPISSRVHQQELPAAPDSSQSHNQRFLPNGDLYPRLREHVNLLPRRTDKGCCQDQSSSPQSFNDQKYNMLNSNAPTRARRTLRSMAMVADYQTKLSQGTIPPAQGPHPIHNGVQPQDFSYSNAPTDLEINELVHPSPLPPIDTGASDSLQEKYSNLEPSHDRPVFQMLPRDTAVPPQGHLPSTID